MPYAKKVFVIDMVQHVYRIYRGQRETVVKWKNIHTPEHLAHMTAFMQRLGYRVIQPKAPPAGITHVSPPQAATLLGVSINSIYSRIKYGTISYEVVQGKGRTGLLYRIPVSALTRYTSGKQTK